MELAAGSFLRCPGPGASRAAGAVDVTDIVTGSFLVILLPLLCWAVGSAVGFHTESDKRVLLDKVEPSVAPPLDATEVEMQFAEARDLYQEIGMKYVNATKSISDGILRDFHRRWGKRCLEKSLTSMNELAGRIKGHPESGKFANVLTQMDALKPGIQKELQYLDSLDILKLDQRPASSEREVLEPAK